MNRSLKQAFLKVHEKRELAYARSLNTFLTNQAKRIADRIEQVGDETPLTLQSFYDRDEEDALLKPVFGRHFMFTAEQGALAELNRHDRKEFDPSRYDFQVPDDIADGITRALSESLDSNVWKRINATTRSTIRDELDHGIRQKLNAQSIARSLREALGGQHARKRALRIARTETTGALNAGHHVGRQKLIDQGLVSATQWLSILDDDARADHLALDRVKVSPGKLFSVGGYDAPFAGHFSLPAEQRVNCRCTDVAVILGDDDD